MTKSINHAIKTHTVMSHWDNGVPSSWISKIKNRFGQDGLSFLVTVDLGDCIVQDRLNLSALGFFESYMWESWVMSGRYAGDERISISTRDYFGDRYVEFENFFNSQNWINGWIQDHHAMICGSNEVAA